MAAAVHLRPLHSFAFPLPAVKAAPSWLPLQAKPGARRTGSRVALLVPSASAPAPASPSPSGKDGTTASAATKWVEWIPRAAAGAGSAVGPEQVLRLISGAAATPICQFVDSPRTFLHSVDPRVKLDQLGRVTLLSGFIFIMLGFGADGAPSLVQMRTPPPSVLGIPNIPCSTSGYSYTILKLGPLQFTRKGLSLASTSASLSFAIFQSASLCLTTTTPEQLASALWWFMSPLKHIGSQLSSSDCSTPDKLEKADSYGNYRYFLQLCPTDI
ncbi:Protein ABCI12, chloroplastic [Zea mays]|uniref:Protein ABCI12, chloroplastic n=2 Tax=Zea mays TaxID=4577 RepID=A0A8J8YQ42_MAIZE|nr:Protein ABCI12 chloroplastic [Zea mays]PWZ11273.1 Protein ABCI12, chloroplastic [Zea mays]